MLDFFGVDKLIGFPIYLLKFTHKTDVYIGNMTL